MSRAGKAEAHKQQTPGIEAVTIDAEKCQQALCNKVAQPFHGEKQIAIGGSNHNTAVQVQGDAVQSAGANLLRAGLPARRHAQVHRQCRKQHQAKAQRPDEYRLMLPDHVRQGPEPQLLGAAKAGGIDMEHHRIVLSYGALFHNIVVFPIGIGHAETDGGELRVRMLCAVFLRHGLPGLLPIGPLRVNGAAHRGVIGNRPGMDRTGEFREAAGQGEAFVYDLSPAVPDLVIVIQAGIAPRQEGLVRHALLLGDISGHIAPGVPLQVLLQRLLLLVPGGLAVLQLQRRQHNQAPAGDNGAHKAQGAQSNGQKLENHMVFHFFSPSSL